jgi:NAD(P)-dependent dehydrogenase (short-subunit alcohol dehydrogenase family)
VTGFRGKPRGILITGGNRGLGLQAAKVLARRGHHVMLTARNTAALATAAQAIRSESPSCDLTTARLDLASFASIREFSKAEAQKGTRFDVILHNAGVIFAEPRRRLTDDGIEESLAVHAVGALLLSQLLMPLMARPSRLIFVGSGLHKPGTMGPEVDFREDDPNLDHNYHPLRAYKNSKLAQIWIVSEWEKRLGASGVHADVVCPGFVPATIAGRSSGLQRIVFGWIMPLMPFANTLDHGAQILVHWCERDLAEPGGRYFDGKAIVSPSADAQDAARAAAFFDWAERTISAGR